LNETITLLEGDLNEEK